LFFNTVSNILINFRKKAMKPKTIIIILITVMVTIVLMNNQEPVTFSIFGDIQLSKLAMLLVFFVVGFIIGFMARGKRKRLEQEFTIEKVPADPYIEDERPASDDPYADENYIR